MEKKKIEIMDTTPVMVNKPQEYPFCRRKANHCTIVVEE
jgi:hypothetical protein